MSASVVVDVMLDGLRGPSHDGVPPQSVGRVLLRALGTEGSATTLSETNKVSTGLWVLAAIGLVPVRPGSSFARRFARRPQEKGNIDIRK